METVPAIQTLALELTNVCQNSCAMCWAQSPRTKPPRPKGYMRYDLFRRLVDELVAEAPPRANLKVALSFGGESLLHPDYDRCLEYLIRKGRVMPMIYTNGILLLRHPVLTRFTAINVSVHRQGYEEMLDALKHFGSQTEFWAHIVETEFTPDEVRRIASELKPYAHVKVHPIISEDLRTANPTPGKCREPMHYLAVLWDGETLPCCHLLSPGGFTMGNAADVGLYGVWEGERYTRLRQDNLEGLPCSTCNLYQLK